MKIAVLHQNTVEGGGKVINGVRQRNGPGNIFYYSTTCHVIIYRNSPGTN